MSNSLKLWEIPLSKLFFYALVMLLPFNINRAYFTETSFYYGYHIFYHTIFIYLTDIIICGLVLNWLWEIHREFTGFKHFFHRILTSPVFYFWLILAISTIVSAFAEASADSRRLSFYGLVKITEFLVVFLYVSQKPSPPPLSSPLKGEEFPSLEGRGWGRVNISGQTVLWLIVIGAVIQSVIGILQYLNQHSLGLQKFGESLLVPGMTGIAEFFSGENTLIRAYGTFPHPNLLAAWLFTSLLAVIWLIYAQYRRGGGNEKSPLPNPPHQGEGNSFLFPPPWWGRLGGGAIILRETFLSVSLILISTGLTLTFSRTVWAVTALAVIGLFIASRFHRNRVFERMQTAQRETGNKYYHPASIAWILVLLTMSLALNWWLFGTAIKDRLNISRETPVSEQESIVDRQHFASVSWEMIKANSILGVGLRNFVVRMDEYNQGDRLLPYQHQPVHNIYLLLWAEAGILGLLSFLWLVVSILRPAKKSITLVVFLGFLFLGFFDHYFLSLHQGGLLFWLVAGIVSAERQ